MIIFESIENKIKVDKTLFENTDYRIDFEKENDDVITHEIQYSKLFDFVDWQKGNRYAKLCITNFIGNVYFYGNTYDVRSPKFLTHLSGENQFKVILNEIEELSKDIIYTFQTPSFILRNVNFEETDPSILLIFNYFKKIILDWPPTINLEASISLIKRNPNFKYEKSYSLDKIEKVKKIDHKTLRSLVSNSKNLVIIKEENDKFFNLPITNFLSKNSVQKYFPQEVVQVKKCFSYDTPENRFIKYFIRYILSFVHKLDFVSNLPSNVKTDISKIKTICMRILNSNFFANIADMKFLPSNSSVLQSRAGYKDIFNHYLYSRFGIKHIFEDFKKESLSVDLKKISDIYEYWVFYKIAVAFLGKEIVIEQQEIFDNGESLKYGICFKKDNITVQYNWSETRRKKSAYSRLLRPDTTVVINKEGKIHKFIFDAKYKVKNIGKMDEDKKDSKSEDIDKMHAYRDAIENVLFAIAVYPGSEFVFYETNKEYPIRHLVEDIVTFEGIGALPLVPENVEQQENFEKFVANIKLNFL